MKIFYLANSIIPSRTANSIHVMNMCQSWADMGHDVELWVPSRKREQESGVADPYAFYNVRPNFKIHYLSRPDVPLGWMISCLEFFLKLGKRRPDLIYVRFLYGSVLPALAGYRVVCDSHEPVWHVSSRLGAIFKWLCVSGRIRNLVATTNALKGEYIANGYPPDIFFVAANGAVEANLSTLPRNWPGRPDALQVGYVGHLYPGKGMEIITALADRIPEMDFHVIGGFDGDVSKWKSKGDRRNLHFHGFVPQNEISPCINRLDICLLPNQSSVRSYGYQKSSWDIGPYTSPLKMFDYMAHGKAILSSDLPVLREVLHEDIALFAPPGDLGAWVEALERLKDSKMRKSLGDAAKTECQERHTWRRRAERILEAIGDLDKREAMAGSK